MDLHWSHLSVYELKIIKTRFLLLSVLKTWLKHDNNTYITVENLSKYKSFQSTSAIAKNVAIFGANAQHKFTHW